MEKYVALLRGLNVGGHRVKMERLRSLFEDLGFADVSTFIASGNVVFSTDSDNAKDLRDKIEEHLAGELGYEVATFLRNPAELAAIAQEDEDAVVSHQVIFLQEPATESLEQEFADLESEMDSFEVCGREIHWRIQCKMSDSPLFGGGMNRVSRLVPMTTRNLNTVRRLVAKIN